MKKTDFVDRIETTRFLGRELLVYLWWKSELYEGPMEVEGFGEVELHLDASLVLECKRDELEQSRMRGVAPSGTKEAKEALLAGKLPTRAHIVITHEEQTFAFHFNADTMATSSVKIPALMTESEDETFFERMHLIEKLEALLGALYEELLRLRLSPEWSSLVAPAIRAWVKGDAKMTRAQLEAIRKRALPAPTRRAS